MRESERLSKVSELNEILPRVRETIKKEKRIKKIMNELSTEKVLPDLADSYYKEILLIGAQCNYENQDYKNVVEDIATRTGFLRVEDIQEEFLEEYIYLLVLDSSFNKKFSMETLFNDEEVMHTFNDMVCKKMSVFEAAILDEIYYERADKELFLKLFK